MNITSPYSPEETKESRNMKKYRRLPILENFMAESKGFDEETKSTIHTQYQLLIGQGGMSDQEAKSSLCDDYGCKPEDLDFLTSDECVYEEIDIKEIVAGDTIRINHKEYGEIDVKVSNIRGNYIYWKGNVDGKDIMGSIGPKSAIKITKKRTGRRTKPAEQQ
jgi:hypothetical protein